MAELALELQGGDVDGLIANAKAGDLAAFEDLIRRHERLVLMTALRLTGNREDAQDAAQQVFFRLYRFLGTFRGEEEFAPWLYRVTFNVCRDVNRRKRPAGALEGGIDAVLRSPEPSADDALLLAEQRRIMAEGLKTLPEKQRAALVLRDIEGLSAREAAAVLGCTEATVRSQASTARGKMKKFADRYLKRHI